MQVCTSLCDGRYPNRVQQGASEANPPACNIILIHTGYHANFSM